MGVLKLSREKLTDELDLPFNAIEDNVINNDRWSIQHEIIFEYEGKYYRTYYSVGATEMQDERPWEYDPNPDSIECDEVRKVDRLQSVWTPVDNGEYERYLTEAEHKATIRALLEDLEDFEIDKTVIEFVKEEYLIAS